MNRHAADRPLQKGLKYGGGDDPLTGKKKGPRYRINQGFSQRKDSQGEKNMPIDKKRSKNFAPGETLSERPFG